MRHKHSTMWNATWMLLLAVYLLNYKRIRRVLIKAPIVAIQYIIAQPTGIGQSKIIKTLLGNAFIYILDLQEEADHAVSLKICACIVSTAYFHVFKFLEEIFYLLNDRTYNSAMGRYDVLHLKTDQIVLSVFLFSVLAIVFFNLVLFYFFFALMVIPVRLFEALLDAAASGCPTKMSLGKQIRNTLFNKKSVISFVRGDFLCLNFAFSLKIY